ncbi:MAG: hypothetical protein ABIR73_07145 [Usitatibacter sp.]
MTRFFIGAAIVLNAENGEPGEEHGPGMEAQPTIRRSAGLHGKRTR